MGYIGRPPSTTVAATATVNTFTGNGSSQFVLTRAIDGSNPALLEVFVSNVQQQPTVSYTVSGNVVSFTEAPASGEPIYIILRDNPTAPVFTIPDDSIVAAKLQTGSVTSAKILDGTILASDIADANITAAKIQNGAVTGDKLDVSSVTTTKILDEAVTTAKIADANVTTSKIQDSAITTALIANDSVTTSKIAANLIVKGIATVSGLFETANIISEGASSNVVFDKYVNSVIFYTVNTPSNTNVTVDFTNLNSVEVGNVTTYVLIATNNLTARALVTDTQINGNPGNSTYWLNGKPTEGDANIDVYSFSVLKTDASAYTILANKSNFQT